MEARECIPPLGAPVAKRGGPIAIGRGNLSCLGGLVAVVRRTGTIVGRLVPLPRRPVVRGLIAAGREVIVRGILIVVRAALIAALPAWSRPADD